MNNVISYNDWKVSCQSIENINEIISTVEKLNFKGYTNNVVGKDENGNDLVVKSRAINRLSELLEYDFSDCFLYKIELVKYLHYYLPDGKSPWDYDIVELSKFESEERHGYKIRYAGKEKALA